MAYSAFPFQGFVPPREESRIQSRYKSEAKMTTRYTTLVLEGGGVKGIAYVGALKALDAYGVTLRLTRFAGTSAGSIIAALLAAGYTREELYEVMMNLDFKKFEDHWDPIRLATRYGLYAGDFLLSWMQDRLETKLGKQPTFSEMPNALHVFATNLNTRGLAEFSNAKTPDVSVAEAVRCSMSIPLFFAAYELNGDLHVDGGVVLNYPITPFEHPDPESVLGLHLDDLSHKKPVRYPLEYDEIVDYVKALFETVVSAQQIVELEFDPVAERQTVHIDDDGISATDFGLTESHKKKLYDNGYAATTKYLEGQGLARSAAVGDPA